MAVVTMVMTMMIRMSDGDDNDCAYVYYDYERSGAQWMVLCMFVCMTEESE